MTIYHALAQRKTSRITPTGHFYKYRCDACGEIIPLNDLVLLREHCALPEESTFHLHKSCVDAFIADHAGRWEKIPCNSLEANWLLY